MPLLWLCTYYVAATYHLFIQSGTEWSIWLILRSYFTFTPLLLYEACYHSTSFAKSSFNGILPPAFFAVIVITLILIAGFYACTRLIVLHTRRHWTHCAFYVATLTALLYLTAHRATHRAKRQTHHNWLHRAAQPPTQWTKLHGATTIWASTPLLWAFLAHPTMDSFWPSVAPNILMHHTPLLLPAIALLHIHWLYTTYSERPTAHLLHHCINENTTRTSRGSTRFLNNFSQHDYALHYPVNWQDFFPQRLFKVYQITPPDHKWIFRSPDYPLHTYHTDKHYNANPLLYLIKYERTHRLPIRRMDSYYIECELTPILYTRR